MFAKYTDTHMRMHTSTSARMQCNIYCYTHTQTHTYACTKTHTHTHTHTHTRAHRRPPNARTHKCSLQKPKNGTPDVQKWFQIPPKSVPRDHPRANKHSNSERGTKKTIFGCRVPHHARKKSSNFDLETTPRQPKMKTLHHVPKSMEVGYSLEPPRQAFGDQNESLWDICART